MNDPKSDTPTELKQGYEDLFNYSVDLLCINGLDGYFKVVNPAFEKLLGYSSADFISRHFLEYIHPDDYANTLAEMEKRKKGQSTNRFENRYRRKDGSYVWIEWTSFPVLEHEVMYAVGHDITERKQAEENRLQLIHEQLARKEAEKGIQLRDDFISIASHELKTPLTALKLQFQMIPKLLNNVIFPDKEKFLTLFHNSLRQLHQFEKLINGLLDITSANAGQLKLELETVVLSNLISEIVDSYRLDLQSAGCPVTLTLDNSIQGSWDPSRIEQVIVNLLTNAMKYGGGKPIRIKTQKQGDWVKISIEDEGIGLKKEDQKKIFDRFIRLTPVSNYRGLGLGLFIAHQILSAHGGTIKVESELGRGSTFIIELPLRTII